MDFNNFIRIYGSVKIKYHHILTCSYVHLCKQSSCNGSLTRLFSNEVVSGSSWSYKLQHARLPCQLPSPEEIPHAQGKRSPSKTVGVARGHQMANTLKPCSQKTSQSNHTRTTALSNSVKLSHARGAT